MKRFILLITLSLGAPFDIAKSLLRVDHRSWSRTIFGPYDPHELEGADIEPVLIGGEDLGFINAPIDPKADIETALHHISMGYDEEDVLYELIFEKNGPEEAESHLLMHGGLEKCKLGHAKTRSLVMLPPSAGGPGVVQSQLKPNGTVREGGAVRDLPKLRDSVLDDLRAPPTRSLQAEEDEETTQPETKAEEVSAAEESNFAGGNVDILFLSTDPVKLTDDAFDRETTEPQGSEHSYSLKGRVAVDCECSHSHAEDTYFGLGKRRFLVRKVHVTCGERQGYKPDAEASTEKEEL